MPTTALRKGSKRKVPDGANLPVPDGAVIRVEGEDDGKILVSYQEPANTLTTRGFEVLDTTRIVALTKAQFAKTKKTTS